MNKILKISLLLFCAYWLVACDTHSQCVYAGDWGNKVRRTVIVDADKEMTRTGIIVAQDAAITMRAGGLIDIKPTVETFDAVTGNANADICAGISRWQDSGIDIDEDEVYTITVSGGYDDINGTQADGQGLYAYIDEETHGQDRYGASTCEHPPSDIRDLRYGYSNSIDVSNYSDKELLEFASHAGTTSNSKYINNIEMDRHGTRLASGGPGVIQFISTPVAVDAGKFADINNYVGEDGGNVGVGINDSNPHFFELYNNGTAGKGPGAIFKADRNGRLWFKYARSANKNFILKRINAALDENDPGVTFLVNPIDTLQEAAEECVDNATNNGCMSMAGSNIFSPMGEEHEVVAEELSAIAFSNRCLWERIADLSDSSPTNCDLGANGSNNKDIIKDFVAEKLVEQSREIDTTDNSGRVHISNGGSTNIPGNFMRWHPWKGWYLYRYEAAGIANYDGWIGNGYTEYVGSSNESFTLEHAKLDFLGDSLYHDTGTLTSSVPRDNAENLAREYDTFGANSGGYKISVGYGHPGRNGKFMTYAIRDEDSGAISPGSDAQERYEGDASANPAIVPNKFSPTGYTIWREHAAGELVFEIVDKALPGTIYERGDGTYVNNPNDPNSGETNTGSYAVFIETTKVDDGFSDAIGLFIKKMNGILFGEGTARNTGCSDDSVENLNNAGIAKTLYCDFVENSNVRAIVMIVLALFMTFYGFSFLFGLLQDARSDFIVRMLKMMFVLTVISPGSWEFFNYYLFSIFIDGTNELILIMSNQASDIGSDLSNINPAGSAANSEFIWENPLQFIDVTLTIFFSHDTWVKIASLLFTSPVGWLYMIFITISIFLYLIAIVRAAIIYVLSFLAISLLIVVFPIFLCLWLFKFTEDTFQAWFNQMMNFLMQPVMLFAALAVFNVFIFSNIYQLLNFTACWDCVWNIEWEGTFSFLPSMCLLNYYKPEEGINSISFYSVLSFIIVTHLMLKVIEFIPKVAARITTGVSSTSLSETASAAIKGGITASGAGLIAGKAMSAAKKGGKALGKKIMR